MLLYKMLVSLVNIDIDQLFSHSINNIFICNAVDFLHLILLEIYLLHMEIHIEYHL